LGKRSTEKPQGGQRQEQIAYASGMENQILLRRGDQILAQNS
jgi:hypothetical protein